jgi:broad specificity phosphatase PhoE
MGRGVMRAALVLSLGHSPCTEENGMPKPMKWFKQLLLVRHGQSVYNTQRELKEGDPDYLVFREAFDRRPGCQRTWALALEMHDKYKPAHSDHGTPLTSRGHNQARLTGQHMRSLGTLPDIIYISPYLRTRETLEGMVASWPELGSVKTVVEDRIREQEHGLAILYGDWRIFQTLHPEQRALRNFDALSRYWYRYPQGESVADVRERARSMTTTLTREHAGQRVLVVTHHLTILSMMANYQRLSPEEFLTLDAEEPPRNCSTTIFKGDSSLGENGRLVLESYNQCLWERAS